RWRVWRMRHYFTNDSAKPSFVIDGSDQYEKKQAALDCFRSQFAPADAGAVQTRLSVPAFRRLIESRDAQVGAQMGVTYAEGLVTRDPLRRKTLFSDE